MISTHWLFRLAVVLTASTSCLGQDLSGVAAIVNDQKITWQDVQRQVARVLRGREANPDARHRLRETARDQLISRQLILRYLARHRLAPSSQDIDVELSRISKRLALEEKTLADYLKVSDMTLEQLRSLLTWQLGWQWYLDRHVTDANLEEFFNRHRVEFDGSQLQVAHILWKAPIDDRAAVAMARQQAEQVRAKLMSKEVEFAAAARQHSESPSGAKGGDIGAISRQGPMPESFSRAAFALQVGEVSPPVATAFGIHLIQCQRIEQGDRRWEDVRSELEKAVTGYLFQWVADKERPRAKIERLERMRTAP